MEVKSKFNNDVMVSLPPEARLEILVGHVSNVLIPAQQLIEGLKLRSNASVTTYRELQYLCPFTNCVYAKLRDLTDETKTLDSDIEGGAIEFFAGDRPAQHKPPHRAIGASLTN